MPDKGNILFPRRKVPPHVNGAILEITAIVFFQFRRDFRRNHLRQHAAKKIHAKSRPRDDVLQVLRAVHRFFHMLVDLPHQRVATAQIQKAWVQVDALLGQSIPPSPPLAIHHGSMNSDLGISNGTVNNAATMNWRARRSSRRWSGRLRSDRLKYCKVPRNLRYHRDLKPAGLAPDLRVPPLTG